MKPWQWLEEIERGTNKYNIENAYRLECWNRLGDLALDLIEEKTKLLIAIAIMREALEYYENAHKTLESSGVLIQDYGFMAREALTKSAEGKFDL